MLEIILICVIVLTATSVASFVFLAVAMLQIQRMAKEFESVAVKFNRASSSMSDLLFLGGGIFSVIANKFKKISTKKQD